ncbi:MAG: UDP-3-O-(3-hydroxymyristoyl)glucosamine N-acyltransferase [Bdellovibrionales bacterium]
MADPRFFNCASSFSLKDIAQLSGSELHGDIDGNIEIKNVAPLDVATSGDVSFLDNVKYKEQFTQTKAGACFVHSDLVNIAPEGIALLVTPTPYKSYALTAQAFYPNKGPDPFISDKACVHETANIPDSCVIHPCAVIEGDVELGEGVIIESGAVIKQGVNIGAHSRVGPNAVISHAIIDDFVNIYPGVKIGQDGFGFAIDPAGFVKVPQLGRVLIGSHVEIGANTTIDRGAGPDTVIGAGTWIDNLVQIGHNVKIGRGCVIVSQVGISGSTVINDYVVIGGQVGIAGHLNIGSGARIAAQSGVMKDIPAGQEMMGSPAIPKRENMRQIIALKRLGQS